MRTKYILTRLKEDTYRKHKSIKIKLENDIMQYTHKPYRINMSDLFNLYSDPNINQSLFRLHPHDLMKVLAKKRKKRGVY